MSCVPAPISQEYMNALREGAETFARLRLAGWSIGSDGIYGPAGQKLHRMASNDEINKALDADSERYRSDLASRWEAP